MKEFCCPPPVSDRYATLPLYVPNTTQSGSSRAMSTPHAWPAECTVGQVRPELGLRCTPPPDQLVPNTTVLRSREHASPGISVLTIVNWSLKIPEVPVVRQYLPSPLPVIPSLTRIVALSLSGTTRMSHGLRNRV